MSNAILSRIKEYLTYKHISIRSFEIKCGFSNGSFASQLKNGKSIGSDRIENILNVFPDINAEWLMKGNGAMLCEEVQQKEEELADQRAAVSDELLDKIEQQAQEIARLQGKIESQNDFIALIIKTLVENSGGGNLHGLLSAKSPASPIDLTNICRDMVDPR